MQWLALIALDGLVVVLLIMMLMRVLARWGWNELRDGLLSRAYESWSYQGEAIPGAKAGLIARVVIRLLSRG
jgi:hypothetical protein